MFQKLTLPGLMLAAALAFLGAPNTQIAAAECGGPGEVLCKSNKSCVSFVFFWQCTTKYDYWQAEEPDEGEVVT